MRPLHITIEGLRSFRSAVSIDFAGRDHLAIVGDTGAGKSSILEAMTYALYGQTTFTAHANQELMNDTSTHLRVVLRFEVSGETCEVARTLRRAGDGTVGQPQAGLRRFGTAGETVEQVEQVRRVNDRVKELIGLDSNAFLRTVILPQGRFARLLVEDEPRDRGRILRQVWRTDELEAAGALAGESRQVAVTLRARLEQAASAWPEDPPAHLAQLEAAGAAATRRAKAASEDEGAADKAREAVLAAEGEGEAASRVARRLRSLHTGALADRLDPIAALDRQLRAEGADLEQRQAQAEEELARIPADDGPTSEVVAGALATLRSIGGLIADGESASRELRARVEDASGKGAEAERLAGEAAAARERVAEHAGKRDPLAESVESAGALRTAVDQGYSSCEEHAGELDGARRHLDALGRESADLDGRLEAARERERCASRAAAQADEHLAGARRSESAAAAAHALHPGDECPICRRGLPIDWEAPASAGMGEAQEAADQARRAAREAEREVAGLGAEGQALGRRISEGGERVAAVEELLRQARRQLARHVDLDGDSPLPPRDILAAPLEDALTKAAGRLAEHDRLHEELRETSAERDQEASAGRAAADGADTLADHARTAVDRALQRLEAAVRSVPPPYRPQLDLFDGPSDLHKVDATPVGERTRSAEAREKVLAEREGIRRRLLGELDEVKGARSDLERRRAEGVDAAIGGIVVDLNGHRDVLVESVGRLGLGTDIPPAVSTRETEALASRIEELQAATAEVSQAAGEQARAAAVRADGARAELTAIGRRLEVEVDISDLDAVVDGAREIATEARFEERRARESAERFVAVIDDVRRLRALLEEVGARERALGDLEDAMKPGAFLKWLTLRRSRRLLVHASRMLGEMSGGRYAFVEPGDSEEQWLVLDQDSGQARSPASLSGGEQFIASLSLALGMVEMMARSGGRLESLFLDEGFGSLDRNNLDSAVQALATAAASGRMVGVISHVRAVAEQIEHVLAVARDAAGSRAQWLTRAQRQQLVESETGWEAASALGGLLE